MNLDLTALKLFIRVAKLKAIAKAGEEFDYSAATATQRLQALEAELGVSLFTRSTRSVALTPDGERFLTHAEKILDIAENAKLELSGGEYRINGTLRVTASATFGRRFIAPHISEFLQLHPQAQLHLELTDGVVDLVEQGFDLAIRIGNLSSSNLKARKLAANPRVLVASKKYLDKNGRPRSPHELKGHACLSLNQDNHWVFQDGNGQQTSVNVSGPLICNNGEAVLNTAIDGSGIAVKSAWDTRDAIESNKLEVVLPDYTLLPEWNIWAVRPQSSVLPARTRLFIEFLESKLKQAGII